MASLIIRHFTDPACPFAFSAEPARLRLRWLYGDQIEWRTRMVVLSQSPDDYVERCFTPEVQVAALEAIRDKYGMPIDTRRRPRMMATVHACRAVVAARLHAPERERALLRRLRIHAMAGDLIDEPSVIAQAAREAGFEPRTLCQAIAGGAGGEGPTRGGHRAEDAFAGDSRRRGRGGDDARRHEGGARAVGRLARARAQARARRRARLPLHGAVVPDRAQRRERLAALRRARLPARRG